MESCESLLAVRKVSSVLGASATIGWVGSDSIATCICSRRLSSIAWLVSSSLCKSLPLPTIVSRSPSKRQASSSGPPTKNHKGRTSV